MNTATTTVDPARLAKHRQRKRVNAMALTLSMAAMAFGLFWLIWILLETVGIILFGQGSSGVRRRAPLRNRPLPVTMAAVPVPTGRRVMGG